MTSRGKTILAAGALVVLLAALGSVFWVRRFPHYTPAAALRDLQAAAQVGHAERPVERYLELRYGPLTDPNNREQALKEFFNVGHIEGLFLIVGKLSPATKQRHIAAMAEWIANYRRTMTADEREALNTYFRSEAGKASIHQATVNYLRKDWRFRADTASVIQELMVTLSAIQQP